MDGARSVVAVAAAALLVVLAGAASAHRVAYPKTDRLHLTPQGLELRIEYVVADPAEATVLVRLFDRDRSGTLEAGEQAALREHLCKLASTFVRLELDGNALPLARREAELLPLGNGQPLAAALTLSAQASLAGGAHTLRISDRHKDRAIAVPLRVTTSGVRIATPLVPQPLLADGRPLTLQVAPLSQ